MSEKSVPSPPSSSEKAAIESLPDEKVEKATEKATGQRTFNSGKEVSK